MVRNGRGVQVRQPPDQSVAVGAQVDGSRRWVVQPVTEGCAMPRGRGISDDEDADEPKGGRPGPSDGREVGMATREYAPEITTADDAAEPPD